MITLLLHLLRLLALLLGGHRQLALEGLALRQQLAVYNRTIIRPPLRSIDHRSLLNYFRRSYRVNTHNIAPTQFVEANGVRYAYRVSASRPGRLGLVRLRAEGSRRVALGSVRPGELALARQLLDPLLLVVRARERREKRHDVVDVVLGQREGLDVLVQIGIL
jgi:hypothetical protein